MPKYVPENEDTKNIESDLIQAVTSLEGDIQNKFRMEEERRSEEKKQKEQKENEEKEFITQTKNSLERVAENLGKFQEVIWMDEDEYSGNFLRLRRRDSGSDISFCVINPGINWPGNKFLQEIKISDRMTYEEALIINSRLKWINKNKIKPRMTGT